MYEIFSDFLEWTIVIFDNILVLGVDEKDCYEKTMKVINRCRERNVFLKLSKSKFGVRRVEFFGYVIEGGTYRLSEERAAAVRSIQFPQPPQQLKKMQRFLGAAIYFRPFIPDYAERTQLLYQMTRKDFDWDPATWEQDFERAFEDFKEAIGRSFTLYHPDYNLRWILKTDASDLAVGGVLVQLAMVEHVEVQQVITFVSKKLSGAAQRWSTIEKECFGIFYSVHKLQYYLTGKEFVILTDHNNLLWMQTSVVPKIIRMRIFLQSFNFQLSHISGPANVFADWLSRDFVDPDLPIIQLLTLAEGEDNLEEDQESQHMGGTSVEDMIKLVHNQRMGHFGVKDMEVSEQTYSGTWDLS
jgi:hypothetical protein